MAVGDTCPIEIPCMPRKKANRFNFLRFDKPQNWTYTELKNDGLNSLIPCDEVESGGGATIVMDFRSDYESVYDAGDENLFDAKVDVLDDSETPRWKTTDDNVDDIQAESPAWDFQNDNEKGIICCMLTPAPGASYPKVDLLFALGSSEPAGVESYVKGLLNLSEFDDIGELDFDNNKEITDIEFGDTDRYCTAIRLQRMNITGTLDFKNTSAGIFALGNLQNTLDNIVFKQAEDEVNQFSAANLTLNNPLDFSGVTIKNGVIEVVALQATKVILESGQEIKEFNTGLFGAGSTLEDINLEVVTLLNDATLSFEAPLSTHFQFPTFSQNFTRLRFKSYSQDSIDFSPLNGATADQIDFVSSDDTKNLTELDFTPFNSIGTLSVSRNDKLTNVDITGVTITTLLNISNHIDTLDQVFPFTNVSTTINEVRLRDNAITQANIDSNFENMYNRGLNGATINTGNEGIGVGRGNNEAPSGLDASGDVPATCPATKSTGADYIRCLVDELGCTVTYWDDVNNTNKTVSL